jgi:hypothetical protein
MLKNNKIPFTAFIFALFLLNAATISLAQVRISSPYTRYGLGEIQNNFLSRNMAMGGITYGVRDSRIINFGNPASYTSYDTNTFVCDIGLISNFSQVQTASVTQGYTNYSTLGYLVFGFPVSKWMGATLGLVPYSKTGYQIIAADTIDNIGRVVQKYDGSGGLNRFFAGTSFLMFKRLSLGVNVSYLFGTISKNRAVYFPEMTYTYNFRVRNQMVIYDFATELGLQYQQPFGKDYSLTFGGKYSLPMGMRTTRDYFAERFTTTSAGDDIVKDTLEQTSGQRGITYMPMTIGGGAVMKKGDKWLVGADFTWENWSAYKSYGVKDSIGDSWRISTGGQYTPKGSSVSGFFSRMSYRLGFRYGKTSLRLYDKDVNEYAVSLGFGVPVRRSRSTINVAFEFGKRGNTTNNLIQENFGKITFGIGIRENWFFRRKLE